MPSLGFLKCSIVLTNRSITLPEVGTAHVDSIVSTRVAVPPNSPIAFKPQPFEISVTTSNYIAPGLSISVLIDGELQCTRTRTGFAPRKHSSDAGNHSNLRLRGKDVRQSDGSAATTTWNFQGRVMETGSTKFNVGHIEVIVQRCAARKVPTPMSIGRLASKVAKKVRFDILEDKEDNSTDPYIWSHLDKMALFDAAPKQGVRSTPFLPAKDQSRGQHKPKLGKLQKKGKASSSPQTQAKNEGVEQIARKASGPKAQEVKGEAKSRPGIDYWDSREKPFARFQFFPVAYEQSNFLELLNGTNKRTPPPKLSTSWKPPTTTKPPVANIPKPPQPTKFPSRQSEPPISPRPSRTTPPAPSPSSSLAYLNHLPSPPSSLACQVSSSTEVPPSPSTFPAPMSETELLEKIERLEKEKAQIMRRIRKRAEQEQREREEWARRRMKHREEIEQQREREERRDRGERRESR